jgi:hypothetical protein
MFIEADRVVVLGATGANAEAVASTARKRKVLVLVMVMERRWSGIARTVQRSSIVAVVSHHLMVKRRYVSDPFFARVQMT